jgi:hypothetical protein
MKIREGAYYRTRGGNVVGPLVDVVGPLVATKYGAEQCWQCNKLTWREAGQYSYGCTSELDLISEVYVSDTPPADAPAPEAKTLRDEFAMAALKGMLARESDLARNVARYAYQYADAMMEARKK